MNGKIRVGQIASTREAAFDAIFIVEPNHIEIFRSTFDLAQIKSIDVCTR
jgi:hypothetical protein